MKLQLWPNADLRPTKSQMSRFGISQHENYGSVDVIWFAFLQTGIFLLWTSLRYYVFDKCVVSELGQTGFDVTSYRGKANKPTSDVATEDHQSWRSDVTISLLMWPFALDLRGAGEKEYTIILKWIGALVFQLPAQLI